MAYIICYKVLKSDATTVIGLIVRDGNKCKFIPKADITKYNYSNARITKNGKVYVTKQNKYGSTVRDVFTRGNGKLILEYEWKKIKDLDLPTMNKFEETLARIRR